MSEPAAPAAPAAPVPAAAPSAPQPPHEGLITKAENWFRHDPAAVAISDDVKAILRGHAGQVFDIAAELVGRPELADLLPKILALAESAAKVGGVTL